MGKFFLSDSRILKFLHSTQDAARKKLQDSGSFRTDEGSKKEYDEMMEQINKMVSAGPITMFLSGLFFSK